MPRSYLFLAASISVLALGACSGSSDNRSAKSDAPMPPITEMDSAMNESSPQSLSASDTLTPVMTSAPSGTMEERMVRLEQSVDSLQNDYQRIAPAFATLNTTNERIQTLLAQIEKETGIKSIEAPISSAPATTSVTEKTTTTTTMMPSPAPSKTIIPAPGTVSKASDVAMVKTVTTTVEEETVEASAPPLSAFKNQPSPEEAKAEAARQAGISSAAGDSSAPSGANNSIKGVRIGEHGAKTRVVFDLANNTKPDFKYDLDNAEKLLVVDMAGSKWSGPVTGMPKSPMIESWAAQETPSGGSTIAIQLKKGAKVLSSEYLKAEGGSPARLVMDIGIDG